MRSTVLTQIKRRRLQLGLKGTDMPLRVGLNRQQYGKIEKDGNPSLATLDKIAEGLDATLMLIPKELARQVEQLLEAGPAKAQQNYAMDRSPSSAHGAGVKETIEDPWQDLGDD
ncbi:helix-turn-helix transcriptional regulator [Ectopseudomonas alcaliphila]|uniref:helix-turn-helix transcriptional regulator n=1 Tax=Ectopseudomonas alcaliphila TaxID=101564 RepID=UPI00278B88F8|nr:MULTISPECIES: helix-turn-helix transcriptional regulator [Pseudomonas]MDP9939323.1 transcriptional regulator with XRE-family HTH domain [Pseudomonas sp. 3400]MDR7011545.1 transcriptional regulator with XRE-family HTH domain [Pseudomonas alcaliphila]